MNSPTCTIIAGPNGAGKTTFAIEQLSPEQGGSNFVNADLIADELSLTAQPSNWAAAARVFLREIHSFIERKEDFAFETTLAGRIYIPLIRKLIADGWSVDLIYLWVSGIDVSRNRVAERVAHGGHDIPADAIVRRYPRSITNLLNVYAELCTLTLCLDNSGLQANVIFRQRGAKRLVESQALLDAMMSSAKL